MVLRLVIVFVMIGVLSPARLSAQGVFEAFGFPRGVISTGHTEVIGSVHIALRTGTTESDTLVIDLSPLRVTNTNASDIQLTTSGNLTPGAVTIEGEQGRVRVAVNAGATSGSLRVDGIRVSLAGTASSSLTARLTWAGLNVFSSNNSVVVVDRVESGLAVDAMTDRFVIFNNQVFDNIGTIVLREGFNTAFVSGTPFGQNSPTQLRVRVTDFPVGLRMQFSATVTSNDSGATLTTVEGTSVTLPRANGSTDVFYNFAGTSNSPSIRESFNIPFTVSANGAIEVLQPTIDISLAPIGTAVPSTSFPSTAVPRFAEENLSALEGTSKTITKTMYWVGLDSLRTNRLLTFNPSSRVANITLTAFDAGGRPVAGTNIANSVRQSLAANQASDQLLTDIFGTGAASIASVRVQSTNSEVVAVGTTSASGVIESTPLVERATANFVLPSIGEGDRIHLFNPGAARVSGTLTLRTAQGALVGSQSLDLDSMASVSRSLQELFGIQTAGQISGGFQAGVIASESFGTPNTLNIIAAQAPAGLPSLYVPFFAIGNGYETDINLMNTSDDAFTLTAQLFDAQGTPLGSARPITMVAGEQLATTISQLFQLQSVASGYVRLDVPQSRRAFWTFYPAISGHVRIRFGQASSTTIPISGYPLQESFILGSGISAGQFQGLALVNPNSAATTVTLQALGPAGTLIGSATVELSAGQIVSKLTNEFFTVPTEGSVIRITGKLPIIATAITGTLNGDLLRSVPGLR